MNKGRMGKLTCITAVATMTCVGLTGCGTKAKDIIKPLENGEYEKALSVYNDAKLSDKETSSLKKQLREKLSKIVDEFNNNSISYNDAKSFIATISEMNISELNTDLATASGSIYSLNESKLAYVNGCEVMAQEKYEEAISYFELVISKDTNYEDASNKITEARDLIYKKLKTEMLELVNENIKNGDYGAALGEIELFEDNNEQGAKDDELKKIYNDYVNEYKTLITGKVEKLLENKAYLSAINMLDEAKKVIDCTEFSELYEKIQTEKPIYLCDVKYQTSDRFEVKSEGDNLKDTIGNEYTANSNLYEISYYNDGWSEYPGSVEYYLGYTYNKLIGNIAVDDVSNDINGVLTIYGDNVSIFTLELNRKTLPEKIEIDISGVNYLKITLSASGEGTLTAIMSDFCFEK